MKNKVYYASIPSGGGGKNGEKFYGAELLAQPLEKYSHNKNLRFTDERSKLFHTCPAYTKFFSNTYIAKSELSFDIGTFGNRIETRNQDQEWYDMMIHTPEILSPDHNHELIQIHTSRYIFFSEEEVNMTQMPAYNHTDIESVFGSFDISKWFRRVNPTIYLPKDKLLNIQRGDPLYYVSFDRPVELVEFQWTEELANLEKSCTYLKTFESRMSLKNLFALFEEKRMKAKILRSIHEQ